MISNDEFIILLKGNVDNDEVNPEVCQMYQASIQAEKAHTVESQALLLRQE